MIRRVTLILLSLVAASFPAAALPRTWGYCQVGAVQATAGPGALNPSNTVYPKVQGSYPSCQITVYLKGTTTLATIYSDENKTSKSNPFTAMSSGYWYFYAEDGKYDIRASQGGILVPFTWGDIQSFDGFYQFSPGGGSRSATQKAQDFVSVKDFVGADGKLCQGDGVHDDTSCMQAGINFIKGTGKTLYLPGGVYKVTTIVIPSFVSITGNIGVPSNTSQQSTTLLGTSGYDIFQNSDSEGTGFMGQIFISNLYFNGGRNGFNASASGLTNTVFHNVVFSHQENAGFYTTNWLERCIFDHVEYTFGKYGWAQMPGVDNGYTEKTLFIQNRFSGSINGFIKNGNATHSEGNVFISPIFNGSGQSPMVVTGAANDWTIINPVFEANGLSAPATVLYTTGTVSANSNLLTVASTAGLAVGQPITVAHAGTNGTDLYTTVSAIAGSVVTMADNAVSSITNDEVTNALWDEIQFGQNSKGFIAISRITIQGALLGNVAGDKIRYAINCVPGSSVNLQNVFISNRPVYDPFSSSSTLNVLGAVRTGTNLNAYSWTSTQTFNQLDKSRQSLWMGNPGKGVMVGLFGTGSGGFGGTFGSFDIMSKSLNRLAPLFHVDGDTGATVLGPFGNESTQKINLGLGVPTNYTFMGGQYNIALRDGTCATGASGQTSFLCVESGILKAIDPTGRVWPITTEKYPLVYGSDIKTAQTSAVPSTGLYNGLTGTYRITVDVELYSAASGGTIEVWAAWTNSHGTHNQRLFSLPADAVGALSGNLMVQYQGPGTISYQTLFTGVSGTPTYDVAATCERMF